MSMLTRDQILAASDIEYNTVSVPKWGGDVRIRSMTGADRATLVATCRDEESEGKFDTIMIALCAVDENGNRMFSVKDVEALGQKSVESLNLIARAIRDLNGIGIDAEASAEKN